MGRFKEALLKQTNQTTGTRGTVIALVGGYLVYMGIKMLRNTQSGLSTMSMPLTLVFMSIMLLAGIGVIAYGAFVFRAGWKKQNAANIPDDSVQDINSQDRL